MHGAIEHVRPPVVEGVVGLGTMRRASRGGTLLDAGETCQPPCVTNIDDVMCGRITVQGNAIRIRKAGRRPRSRRSIALTDLRKAVAEPARGLVGHDWRIGTAARPARRLLWRHFGQAQLVDESIGSQSSI